MNAAPIKRTCFTFLPETTQLFFFFNSENSRQFWTSIAFIILNISSLHNSCYFCPQERLEDCLLATSSDDASSPCVWHWSARNSPSSPKQTAGLKCQSRRHYHTGAVESVYTVGGASRHMARRCDEMKTSLWTVWWMVSLFSWREQWVLALKNPRDRRHDKSGIKYVKASGRDVLQWDKWVGVQSRVFTRWWLW